MPFHSCVIQRMDGTELAAGIQVTIEETERGGEKEWYGTASVTHLVALSAGQKYRLVLDDGRTGEFMVRRNTYAGGADRSVAFHGTAPLA